MYSTTVFTREAVSVISSHPFDAKPLFLYLAYQGVHAPAQVPSSYVDPYRSTITDPKRQTFAGMLSCVDEGINNVTDALQAAGAFSNTLIVFTADNGGPTTTGDGVGARNWPLRGGKHSIWEGGTRATAFISGTDALNEALRSGFATSTFDGLMHGADWLPTIGTVAGFANNGTLPLDGVSQWAGILGGKRARSTIVIGNSTNECSWSKDDPRYHRHASLTRDGADLPAGVWKGSKVGCGFAIKDYSDNLHHWKLIKGYGGGPDTWCNSSQGGAICSEPSQSHENQPSEPTSPPPEPVSACPKGWCLYDTKSDPYEEHEISSDNAAVVSKMQADLARILTSYHQYTADTSCPPVAYGSDPVVGKTWEPWC